MLLCHRLRLYTPVYTLSLLYISKIMGRNVVIVGRNQKPPDWLVIRLEEKKTIYGNVFSYFKPLNSIWTLEYIWRFVAVYIQKFKFGNQYWIPYPLDLKYYRCFSFPIFDPGQTPSDFELLGPKFVSSHYHSHYSWQTYVKLYS